jgi:hypothetical protein
MSGFDAAAATFAQFKVEMDKKNCDVAVCHDLVNKLKVGSALAADAALSGMQGAAHAFLLPIWLHTEWLISCP